MERGGPRIVLPSLGLVRHAPEPRKEPVAPVVHACHVLGELADDLGKKLQARFGGRTALNEPGSTELKN